MKKAYERSFKVSVCEEVMSGTVTHNEAALKYGISAIMLYRWISEYKEKGAHAFCGKGSLLAVNAEMASLREENARLRSQNQRLTDRLSELEKKILELETQTKDTN